MAIVQNFWLKDQRKRLAGAVIYQAMGQTRSRRLAETITNPRTPAQMNQRVKWANLVNLYRVNSSWMKYAFETKKQNQSEYNKFMSLNVSASNIYLPKQIANAGGCIVAPYIFTQGSLPSIEFVSTADDFDSNIILDNLYQWNDNITVADFSAMLVRNNPAIRQGDQLSLIWMYQGTNQETGVPYISVREYEVIINSSDSRALSSFIPNGLLDSSEAESDCRLRVLADNKVGGFVMCLSRTVGGRTLVSTQRVIISNNDALINAYSSPSALQTAIDSYGEGDSAFLSSGSADENSNNSYIPSIVSFVVGTRAYAPGQRAAGVQFSANTNIAVNFNQPVDSLSPSSILVQYWKDGSLQELIFDSPDTTGNVVHYTIGAGGQTISNAVLARVIVEVDNLSIEADFPVYNSDTIVGME